MSSTVNALYDLTEKIISCHDEKTFCMGIFIDPWKAFDTVDHDILVEHYSIRGVSGDFLRLYLKNRTHDLDSDILNVKYGLPQGSVMEPVLFNLYINNIICASTKLEFVLFADDTDVFYSSECVENIL